MRLKPWLRLILTTLVLLSSLGAASGDTLQPTPSTAPQSHRERTSEQETSADYSYRKETNRIIANALALATPSGAAENNSSNSADRGASEEERHDRQEESLEGWLVVLTAVLAGIEVATLIIYFFTMLASLRAADAAKRSADVAHAAITTGRPYIQVAQVMFRPKRQTEYRSQLDVGGTSVPRQWQHRGPSSSYSLQKLWP